MYYRLAITAGLATLAFLGACESAQIKLEKGEVDTAGSPDETEDSTIPEETGETGDPGETGDTGENSYIFEEEPRALIHFNNAGIGSIVSVNIEELLAAAEQINDGDTSARPEVVAITGLPVGRLLSSGGRVFLLGADTLTQIDPVTADSIGDDYNSWFTDFVNASSSDTPLDVQYSPVTEYTYVSFESGTLIINPDGSMDGMTNVSEGHFEGDSSTWVNGPGGVDANGIYYQTVNLGDRIGFMSFDGGSGDHNNDSIANTAFLYSAHLLFNPITNLFYGTNDSGIISLDPAGATDGEVSVATVIDKEDFTRAGGSVPDGVRYDFRDPHFIGGENNFSSVVEYEWEEGDTTQHYEELGTIMASGTSFILSDPDEPDAYSELLDTVSALTRSSPLVMIGLETDEVHVWRYAPDDGVSQRVTLPGDGLFSEYGSPASVTSGTLSESGEWADYPWELGGEFYHE